MKVIVKALLKMVGEEIHGADAGIQFFSKNGELLHTENFSGKISFDPVNPYIREIQEDMQFYAFSVAQHEPEVTFDWEIVE